MRTILLAGAAVLAAATGAVASIGSAEMARLTTAARVVEDIHAAVPQDYWNHARCVAVIPELKKTAFIVGGEYGKGVMSCRSAAHWSPPLFIQLARGSWGFQAGAEQVDLVMLVMNEQGVQKLLENTLTLGADAAIAAGPVGRHAQAGTDVSLQAEILSYSRAQGLFAGIDLSGGIFQPDAEANHNVYGAPATPRTILAGREISAPTQASAFLNALSSMTNGEAASTGSTSGAAAAASSEPATSRPVPTTDSDVRARIVDMQQTLDRLLLDSPSSAVGAKVTIDRAGLVQLRRELDAMLLALDRR